MTLYSYISTPEGRRVLSSLRHLSQRTPRPSPPAPRPSSASCARSNRSSSDADVFARFFPPPPPGSDDDVINCATIFLTRRRPFVTAECDQRLATRFASTTRALRRAGHCRDTRASAPPRSTSPLQSGPSRAPSCRQETLSALDMLQDLLISLSCGRTSSQRAGLPSRS